MFNFRSLLTFCLCLSTTVLFAQFPLEIHIKDCRREHTIGYFKFKVYRKKMLIDSFNTTSKNPKTLLLLKKGAYRMEYKTFWGEKETVLLTIKEKKKYVVNLCLEYSDLSKTSHTPIINQLENGEKYQLNFRDEWGYGYSEQTLIIRKRADQYFASFGEKEIELSSKQIELIQDFEIELNQVVSYHCTNTDTYTLTYKNEVTKILDRSCWWDGGSLLIKDLGFKEQN
ncbi:MAG: hypothetical protein ACI976_002571 [Aureispira sp.]|jgi:hypothetical protein